jgi:8-oxo-dGTP pyrophosphatase MutT (NUDIX family)
MNGSGRSWGPVGREGDAETRHQGTWRDCLETKLASQYKNSFAHAMDQRKRYWPAGQFLSESIMSENSLPPWKVEAEHSLLETPIFEIMAVRARSGLDPDKAGDFAVARCPDWVNIIALTDNDEVVLVEQHRHGLGDITLEIPGGMVDGDEGFLAAGLRELAEETGYTGSGAELIGVVTPNPAFQTNRCGTVLVRGVSLTQSQDPDPMEEIRVHTLPLDEIPEAIRSGRIHHALVVCAFHHLRLL